MKLTSKLIMVMLISSVLVLLQNQVSFASYKERVHKVLIHVDDNDPKRMNMGHQLRGLAVRFWLASDAHPLVYFSLLSIR